MKRFFAILLIFSILILQVDQTKKQAQAVLPAIIPISYIATAMVAAGAVGYFTKDENGVYGGNLYDAAKSAWDDMSTDLQNGLNTALAVGSFVTMSAIPGLWDFLHAKFISDGSLVPTIPSALDFHSFFDPNVKIVATTDTIYIVKSSFSNLILAKYSCITNNDDGIFTSIVEVAESKQASALKNTNQEVRRSMLSTVRFLLIDKLYPRGVYNVIWPTDGITNTGTWPSEYSQVLPPGTINDGTADRIINIPLDPTSLSMATATTTYPDRNGVITTPIPSPETQTETGNVDADRAAAAAAAAAAAIAAALAAGHSQAAADAAGAAASAAILAGQTAAQAVAAGAAAAIAYVSATTGILTTDIANTKTGDTLDFSKLKFAATLFTNKFPFSLPWDLKNMITSFGVNSVTAPSFPIVFSTISTNLSLERFNDIAASARVIELFIFNIALLMGTRKFLGGAS